MAKRGIEHKSFTADSYGSVLSRLSDYLNSVTGSIRLVSVQETNTGSRLVAEYTFEYWGTYLIAWEEA